MIEARDANFEGVGEEFPLWKTFPFTDMLRYFYAVDEEVDDYFWRIQPVIILELRRNLKNGFVMLNFPPSLWAPQDELLFIVLNRRVSAMTFRMLM